MRAVLVRTVLVGAAALLPVPALAGPGSGAAGAAKPRSSADQPTPAESDRGLRLDVSEEGPGLPWRMSIVNRGHERSLLVADPSLLWFEVRVPGKRRTQTCRLPHGLFPSRPADSAKVVLRPGEGVVHSFDPRLYCFASGGQWRLVPGAFVTPHFGWPEKKKKLWRHGRLIKEPAKKQSAPFVAGPPPQRHHAHDEDDAAHSVKELEAEPFALRSTYAEWSSTRIGKDTEDAPTGPLELTISRGSDASRERTATIAVRLKNRSKHGVHFFLRRELVSFEVMGPEGLETCDPQPDARAPDRQAFLYLRAGHSMTIYSRLVELCPRGTFAQPGLYLVHARYDATSSGARFGLHAFVGRVVSRQPGSIRIRHGAHPFMMKRRMRAVRFVTPQPDSPNEGQKK
jgi:hypothetical protein